MGAKKELFDLSMALFEKDIANHALRLELYKRAGDEIMNGAEANIKPVVEAYAALTAASNDITQMISELMLKVASLPDDAA